MEVTFMWKKCTMASFCGNNVSRLNIEFVPQLIRYPISGALLLVHFSQFWPVNSFEIVGGFLNRSFYPCNYPSPSSQLSGNRIDLRYEASYFITNSRHGTSVK